MEKDIIKTQCSDCKNETNHAILFCKPILDTFLDEAEECTKEIKYSVIQCKGCESVSFLETISWSNDLDESNNQIFYQNNYPEENDDVNFLKFDHLYSLPKPIKDRYEEVKSAFDATLPVLAGVGLRILAETICINQQIQGNTLYDKLKKLKENGIISNNSYNVLIALKNIGNASAHEIKVISWSVLFHTLEVINQTIREIYILPKLYKKMAVTKKKK